MAGFDGGHLFPQLPFNALGAGVDLGGVMVLPPGGNVIYVRSTLPDDFDPPGLSGRTASTLASALSYCRASRGDVIVVLPGHSESVTDANMLANLVAGTKIIGMGWGASMPTFRWTATGASWAVNKNDVLIKGLRLRLEGANGVVKAINVTGSDVTFLNNDIEVASGASAKATIAMEWGSGALNGMILANRWRGTETHNVTDGIKVVGATTPDNLTIAYNDMIFSATAANGNVHVTVAAKRLNIRNNTIYNTHTASSACIAVDNVAADGVVCFNNVATQDNSAAATGQGVVFNSTGSTIRCFENYSSDEARKSGILTPVAAT